MGKLQGFPIPSVLVISEFGIGYLNGMVQPDIAEKMINDFFYVTDITCQILLLSRDETIVAFTFSALLMYWSITKLYSISMR